MLKKFQAYVTQGGEPYYFFYWWPYDYYSTYGSRNKIPVTISVDGFPSQYSVDLKVDDAVAGSIVGGGSVYVEVDWKVGHTFAVQSYVDGAKGERFYCAANTWYLEKFARWSRDAKAANTFHYTTQYFFSVSTPHGDANKNTGWYAKGSTISLSTPRTVDISPGVKEIFDGWNVGGSMSKDPNINILLDGPKEAVAIYHKEFYLQV